MQCASCPTREVRSVEEDTGAIDDTRMSAGAVAEDATVAGFGMTLEAVGVQGGRERGDHPGFVDVTEVGADGAAPKTKMFRRLRTDAKAASAPQARPRRCQELHVKTPQCVAIGDLFHGPLHGTTLWRSSFRVVRDARTGTSA